MLVLSRERDETIIIGDDIEITVVDIRGDKVRLGITAPKTIPVHRKEVYEAIQRENREAGKVKFVDVTPPKHVLDAIKKQQADKSQLPQQNLPKPQRPQGFPPPSHNQPKPPLPIAPESYDSGRSAPPGPQEGFRGPQIPTRQPLKDPKGSGDVPPREPPMNQSHNPRHFPIPGSKVG
jgi:carbon storage regulator